MSISEPTSSRQPATGTSEARVVLPSGFSTQRITPIKHTLADHPLLTLPALRALAARSPADRVRWHRADIPVSSHFGKAAHDHANGSSLLETIDTIEQAKSWVYLQHIEEVPGYAELVRDIFASAAPQVDTLEPGACEVFGWCFISSPGAVTPYHMDHETNFLMQVRGSKTISVWDPQDRSVVSEKEMEKFHALWSLDDTHWREELEPRAVKIEARPGDGVFMPYTAPHAVKNHGEVSITLSVTFQTSRTKREQMAFAANYRLRRLGLSPSAVGKSVERDRIKATGLDLYTRGRALLNGKTDKSKSSARY